MRWAALLVLSGILAAGIIPVDEPIPRPGQPGAPRRPLNADEQAQFLRGRALFDHDFSRAEGLGPMFNGDSCRSCHLDPVVGGAGGIDVQVQRPMMSDGQGGYFVPEDTGELAQTHCLSDQSREEIPVDVAFVEERNSPSLLGLGLVDTISEATIILGEDPADDDGDGILGIAHVLPGGAVGRFGWKCQVPDLPSFLRDAMGNELGMTVPVTGNPFGFVADQDGVSDPELSAQDFDDILFFMRMLDFAPKLPPTQETAAGEALFESIGCAKCHTPTLDGVELYSNLLLHDVLGSGFLGVAQGDAASGLYRTPPLRGLRNTPPYFHDGRSETVDDAIRRHGGEASAVRALYEALTPADQAALLAFLNRL